jgi:2-haloalkanoic acid dehalogenase type II
MIRDLVLNEITDDYEDLEQIARAVSPSEAVPALAELIARGFAKAYRLSAAEPEELEGMPDHSDLLADDQSIYFYITPAGQAYLDGLPGYDAVLFDLLTALLDSWTLWNSVAGGADAGRRWRAEYLQITYRTGVYRPYNDLVAEAAGAVGLPRRLADELDERYSELQPWTEARETLQALADAGIPLGVVTNCSERLGRIAADRLGVDFRVIVTAERAGFYKPDPRPYSLALQELGTSPEDCLFVAGSAYDLTGTARLGMPTYWHDRIGMTPPAGTPVPLAHERSLTRLARYAFVL